MRSLASIDLPGWRASLAAARTAPVDRPPPPPVRSAHVGSTAAVRERNPSGVTAGGGSLPACAGRRRWPVCPLTRPRCARQCGVRRVASRSPSHAQSGSKCRRRRLPHVLVIVRPYSVQCYENTHARTCVVTNDCQRVSAEMYSKISSSASMP